MLCIKDENGICAFLKTQLENIKQQRFLRLRLTCAYIKLTSDRKVTDPGIPAKSREQWLSDQSLL